MAKASPGVLKLPGHFQFLGIPPKGEQFGGHHQPVEDKVTSFQFLGIPPKGELQHLDKVALGLNMFPISRDPPEGGTAALCKVKSAVLVVSNF